MSESCHEPPPLTPHRRQYVIGPHAVSFGCGWLHEPLEGGLVLSRCPGLPRLRCRDAEGRAWVVLGWPLPTSQALCDLEETIALTPTCGIRKLLDDCAGRWLAIGGGFVEPDASALLNCLHTTTRDGEVWASSSPVLIERVHRGDAGESAHSTCPSCIGNVAGASEVRRLWASQRLRLSTGEVEASPLMPPIPLGLPYDEAIRSLAERLVTAVRALSRMSPPDRPLLLGLTAGGDCRLTLAVAHAAGVPVACFTRQSRETTLADVVLPPQLADWAGLEHRYVFPARRPPTRRLETLIAHSADAIHPKHLRPLFYGERDHLQGFTIGGELVESGKALRRHLPPRLPAPDDAAHIAARTGDPFSPRAVTLMRTWLEHNHRHPHQQLDWRDRYQIEQPTNGWQAAKEQAYDLESTVRSFPTNAAAYYATLLSIDETKRRARDHHREVIRLLCPKLLDVEFNPRDATLGRCRAARHWVVRPRWAAWRIYRGIQRRVRPRPGDI